MRLEHLGEGYDAEGRLRKIEYNKLDFGSEFAFYDLNDDCVVEGADIGLVANAFGLSVGQQGYNPRYDLNSSGSIDTADISPLTGSMYGKYCPRFIYDADGNLTKVEGHLGQAPPKPMIYIGGIYEKNLETQEVTKYYFGPDGRRIAMRKTPSSGPSTLYYFAQDHLGGTALVMNSTGGVVSRMGYYPYGMTWTETGAMPTDRLYTGQQRFGAKSGMYNYVSRFYSADIGRFPEPDSLVGGGYTYVGNNPANYTDPTGHFGIGVMPGPDFGGGGGGSPVPPPGYDDGAQSVWPGSPGSAAAARAHCAVKPLDVQETIRRSSSRFSLTYRATAACENIGFFVMVAGYQRLSLSLKPVGRLVYSDKICRGYPTGKVTSDSCFLEFRPQVYVNSFYGAFLCGAVPKVPPFGFIRPNCSGRLFRVTASGEVLDSKYLWLDIEDFLKLFKDFFDEFFP